MVPLRNPYSARRKNTPAAIRRRKGRVPLRSPRHARSVTLRGSWRLRSVFPSVARAARSEGFLRETTRPRTAARAVRACRQNDPALKGPFTTRGSQSSSSRHCFRRAFTLPSSGKSRGSESFDFAALVRVPRDTGSIPQGDAETRTSRAAWADCCRVWRRRWVTRWFLPPTAWREQFRHPTVDRMQR